MVGRAQWAVWAEGAERAVGAVRAVGRSRWTVRVEWAGRPAWASWAVRRARWALWAVWAVCLVFAMPQAFAAPPDFDFRPPATVADPATPAIMGDLATRLIPVYEEADPDRYLANLSALQMAAGEYAAASSSRESLRERRRTADRYRPVGRAAIFDVYAKAKAAEASRQMAFPEAFAKAFQDEVFRLDDQDAYAVNRWLATTPADFRDALQRSFDRLHATQRISQADAVALIWTYNSYTAYRDFGALVGALEAQDDKRRYIVDDVVIETRDRVGIAALVIRPKSAANPLPALFEFTLRHAVDYAKECAAHGYAGVVAYTRGIGGVAGKGGAGGTGGGGGGGRSDRVLPYQRDGDDARAVLAWIARQSWSDGRVGMYGEGYSGFTAWAAAKRPSPALKAIATSVARAPGIDTPMEGGIFHNAAYRWSLQMTNPKVLEDARFNDEAVWRAFDEKWYRSGRRYRDLGRIFGQANPIFIRWLNHPSYDRYWQKMVPFGKEFAHIDIPVLTATGYYAASEPGDLYFFTQHHRYAPHADHMLIVGPYDDSLMQHAPPATLHGYALDPAAVVDLHELRYQWFDHVFKGGALQAPLTGAVNYQVMGANEWRHAASLDAMADTPLRLYLELAGGTEHALTPQRRAKTDFVAQSVSLLDREDAGWTPPAEFIAKHASAHDGVTFVSAPFTAATEVSGLVSGRLDFTVNKLDMDLYINLYDLLPNGDYVSLFGPAAEFRASYAQDRVHRRLLKAGERQTLAFKSERITSRQLQPGSRLVMVLGVSKRADREVNYGTGNDVSEESLADGTVPLKIRWYSDSYVDIPVRAEQAAGPPSKPVPR
jgi:putative CocE/NonD family hydrolase